MEPRVLRVERVFPNSFLQGRDYSWFQKVFDSLVEEIKLRICGCFMDKQATFIMNREMYRLFYSVAPMNRGPYWDGIYIKEDLTPEHVIWGKDIEIKSPIIVHQLKGLRKHYEFREEVSIQFLIAGTDNIVITVNIHNETDVYLEDQPTQLVANQGKTTNGQVYAVDLDGDSWDMVSATIQKQGGDSGDLTVQIIKDGKVTKEESTTAAYGVVSVVD